MTPGTDREKLQGRLDTEADLHILNGDCALELWKQCGFRGQSLVWRETYLEGPLPDTDDLHVFRTARAEYLSHFAELAGIGVSRLYRHLQKLDEAVLSLPDRATLMLWFDSCIFDQTLLMRILYLLGRREKLPKVFLYCCEGNCLEKKDFFEAGPKTVRLRPDDLKAAGEAWLLFLRKDADGMRRLAQSGRFGRLPKMAKALLRCADEIPDFRGLTLTQRQILELVAAGRHSFAEIFAGQSAFEEYPFLGDTACQRLLDQLVQNGFLVRNGDNYELP